MELKLIKLTDITLLYAFRYALIRRTTAADHIVYELTLHWPELESWMREQIVRDIEQQAKHSKTAGGLRDYDPVWEKILQLDAEFKDEDK